MKRSRLFLALVFLGLAGTLGLGADLGEAPDFRLPEVRTGRTVALSDLARDHKAVAVIFIATGCPYSNAFNHVMSDLARRYESQGVAFVGINSNKTEPVENVRRHAEQHGFPFPVLKDEGSAVADLYKAQVTPEVFLVTPDLKVVYHGALGNSRQPTTKAEEANGDELAAALDEFLAGKPVSTPQTKMFGCTIKR
ncbi:MAG: hypothetical protein Kow00109_12340 [Acidobacteriota bacterium]